MWYLIETCDKEDRVVGFSNFQLMNAPPIFMANKNRIQTIKDDTARGNNITRRFMPLKIDTKPIINIQDGEKSTKEQKCNIKDGNLKKHKQPLCHQLSRITNCNIYYAYVAMKEREILAHTWKKCSDDRSIDEYTLSQKDHADLSTCTAILKQMGM